MKNYVGNPQTGMIIVLSDPGELNPRMIEAMNFVSHSGFKKTEMFSSTWEVTEAMYLPATNILHSYGYTPAVRPGG